MKHLLLSMLLFLLIGCAAQADDLTDEPIVVTDEPTQISEATPTAEAITPRPTRTGRPSNTPYLTATTPATDPLLCMYEADFPQNLPMPVPAPDPAALRWETGSQGERRLVGLNLMPNDVKLSPDGRFLAATFYRGSESQAPITATMRIDLHGDQHRLLATEQRRFTGFYEWLPDSRLLWINDAGQVFLDDTDLNAPAPMRRIEARVGDIVFIKGDNWDKPTYRIDLTSGEWEMLTTADGEPVYSLRGISHDGTYALTHGSVNTFSDDYPLYRIPVAMGTTAEYIMTYTAVPLGGDGYLNEDDTVNLAGTNVWVIDGPFVHWVGESLSYAYNNVIVDLDAQKMLTAEDLGLDPAYIILNTSISDNGQVMLVELTRELRYEAESTSAVIDAYYLTDSNVIGGVLGETPQVLDVNTFPLPEGALNLVQSAVADPPFFIGQIDAQTASLFQMNMAAEVLAALDLSAEFDGRGSRPWALLSPDDSTVYFAAVDSDISTGGCVNQVAIIAWDVSP